MLSNLKFELDIALKRWPFRKMELRLPEVLAVAHEIKSYPYGCNFLVFGVGYDSAFWHRLNPRGRTVFLEDHSKWYQSILEYYPFLEAYVVNYDTRLSQWRKMLDRPDQLSLRLPEKLRKMRWDVILVDGPKGDPLHYEKYGIDPPGRMQSIFTAAQYVQDNGSVFVHDCDREVESTYADRFLKQENLVNQVRGRAILRHYVMKSEPAVEVLKAREHLYEEKAKAG